MEEEEEDTFIPPQIFNAFEIIDRTSRQKHRILSLPQSHLNDKFLNLLIDETLSSNLETLCSFIWEINLKSNQLVNFPIYLNKITRLERLNLEGNYVKEIPINESIYSLKSLNLNNNRIQYLPLDFKFWSNLRTLDLKSNQILLIPKSIEKLENLIRLDLSGNLIKEVPKELGKLENLKELFLDENKISYLPFELIKLKNLIKLGLNDNLWDSPNNDESFKKFFVKKKISLKENCLRKILNEEISIDNFWLPLDLKSSLSNFKTCTICKKKYFECAIQGVAVGSRIFKSQKIEVPIFFSVCSEECGKNVGINF
eukprot:gene4683-8255_t